MKKESKIGKSVRLSKDQIAYIEEQEGKDFSSKLSGLLKEVASGEAERKKWIAYYDGLIQNYEKEVDGYRELLTSLCHLRTRLLFLEESVAYLLDLFSTEGASADSEAK